MQDQGYRSTLALHIPQEQIPFGGVASESSKSLPAEASTSAGAGSGTGSGSGYGPPQPATATPLQRLAQQHLSEDSDFELLCAPLSNGSWRQRFERMCIASPNVVGGSDSRSIFAGSQQHLAKYNSSKNEDDQDAAETAARVREAELWRLSGCFKRGEVNATRSDETSQLLALASDWLELDSEVEGIRFDSELALKQEVAYAAHLHVQTLILPPPRQSAYVTDYARAVASVLSTPGYIQLAVRLPISDPNPDPFAPSSVPAGASKSWEMWNTIRAYCSYNPRLSVCLELSTPSLPSPSFYERWHAEPIRHIFLPASAYLANAKGYPVLSKACQAFFKSVFKFRPTIIMSGIEKGHHSSGGQEAYTAYLRFLERKTPMDDPLEQFATGYMDFLQAPLQPLMDNLENDTYEGFERDPVKYRQYEEAVYQALADRAHRKKAIEIFVCGAGRGPLVEGCLRASRRAQVSVRLTAVEKNPNAFVTLQERKATEWGDSVDLVFSDMRAFNPPRPADIIVSELLGSFGDNELSPECLDGVMRTLAPDGISIPCSYTSYLAPVTNQKLHSETSNSTDSKFPEQPYVVMFQSVSVLSATGGRENYAKFAECWGFDHPRNDVVCDEAGLPLTNHHNARSAHVTFHIPNGGICHGFGGYFEAILYNDIGISIHPERMDKNMLSWFPLFFPLKDPLYLPPRSELDVHIFRLIDGTKRRVWFEWSADVYLPLPSLTMASSPPTSASMQTATSNGTHPSMRVRGGSPMDTRSFSNASQGISPHLDNFASAPSPFIGNESMSSAGFMLDAGNRSMAEGIVRVKVGQSRLHNPAGRSSWVGL